MNSYSTSWWSLLLIYRPREDERLSWPCWLIYSGRFTHINGYSSAAGSVQTSESSPVRDRRSTTELPNQPKFNSVLKISKITLIHKFLLGLFTHIFTPHNNIIQTRLLSTRRMAIANGTCVCFCSFLLASAMLKHVLAIGCPSVRLSVRHTLVLYQNG